ncbi:MAG: ATP-binding protein [Cyclobacteriaceae bacterium]|nr:ATP-binding protein [Cyclobacteriaceae bacterium]
MENNGQPRQSELHEIIDKEILNNGGEWASDPNCEGATGMTMFDLPNSQDNLISVLLPMNKIKDIGAHSIVEIRSRSTANGGDGKIYRGIVVAGPFHDPDGIRADAPILISTTINGAIFLPNFHGRVLVELLGELNEDAIMPPRFRPLPNSPVFVLDKEETANVLNVQGNVSLGQAIGHDSIDVCIPADKKVVLPRHTGILGTTGGGKSTTVSGLIDQFQKEGIATILIDTEGEYTHMDKATEAGNMKKLLSKRGIDPHGIENIKVYYPFGRETRADESTPSSEFNLKFSNLSPYAAADILGLTEAQFSRFIKIYDAAKLILRDLGIYPTRQQQNEVLDYDEFESGYPHITLSLLIDIAGLVLEKISVGFEWHVHNNFIRQGKQAIAKRIEVVAKGTDSETSWKALLGKLGQLNRTKMFDRQDDADIPYTELVKAGTVSIFDLSDSDSTLVNNIVIANLLRGVQQVQEAAYEDAIAKSKSPTPVVIIIEEAHEFLSKERINKMSNLFEQVARIARRGRKRWLGLMFVTQLPQHLPDEVLGLINSFVLHKINDATVVSRLKRSIGGVEESLWNKLPNLAQGQAIVSTPSLTRPLLVAMHPTPCKLLMVD